MIDLLKCPSCGEAGHITILAERVEFDREESDDPETDGRIIVVRSGEAVCGCGFHSNLQAFEGQP